MKRPTEGADVATKPTNKPAKRPASPKARAHPDAEKKHRGEARADRARQRNIEAEQTGRGGPQGRKDKDFQRKH
jgi:hypothetical protein